MICVAVLGVVLCVSTSVQADSLPAAKGSDQLPVAGRLVIPDVCAWPNLTVLPNGEIAAIIFNQPSHGRMTGELDCWVSSDEGQTWQRRTSPVVHEPGTMTNRMNDATGLAQNGDLIVLCSGWTLIEKPVKAFDSTMDVDNELDVVVCRSSDRGRTWTVTHGAFPKDGPDGGTLVPYGDIAADADGSLRVAAYAMTDPEKKFRQAYVLESYDDGKTWQDPRPIDADQSLNETFLHCMPDGRWLALARGTQLWLYESTDSARSWRLLKPVTENNEIPGHLMTLRNGSLLLCAGRRVKGDEGVIAKISHDGGQTWSTPARLASFIGFDGGYPSCAQLPDGRVLTAYYAKKTEDHDGYHMGQVIWDPQATFPAGE